MPAISGQKPVISIRVDLAPAGRLGPGKIDLLEAIEQTGSISGAGRAMTMSYRRAWLLVDNLNRMFRQPLVEASPGGAKGGGARLTAMGREVVAHYRAIESKALKAASLHIDALQDAAAEPGSAEPAATS
ncbi:winged helix-turn-helix domain-containing protein [Bosea sp. (in: a-proteobacteria)]|jgi:molybdate transport system regulatory protein|uniref:winged helix-turn-helix domain-containing protein n=1 Tax=Bosea sp. (in: a-proteobacteria) TaxID=1871050 RepID=UPI0035646C6D